MWRHFNSINLRHQIERNFVHPWKHRLNMELDLQSLFGLLCTAVLIGWDPATPSPSPRIWSHIRGRYWSAKTTSLCNPLLENIEILYQKYSLSLQCFLLKEMPGPAVCAGRGGAGLHPREPLRLRGGQRRQQHHRLRTPTECIHHGITRYSI